MMDVACYTGKWVGFQDLLVPEAVLRNQECILDSSITLLCGLGLSH